MTIGKAGSRALRNRLRRFRVVMKNGRKQQTRNSVNDKTGNAKLRSGSED